MLYVHDIGEVVLNIPRNVLKLPEGAYRMTICSTVERTEYTLRISNVTETLLMLLVRVTMPKVSSGSYEYRIFKGNTEIGEGMLEVATKSIDVKEYNNNESYEQYEAKP